MSCRLHYTVYRQETRLSWLYRLYRLYRLYWLYWLYWLYRLYRLYWLYWLYRLYRLFLLYWLYRLYAFTAFTAFTDFTNFTAVTLHSTEYVKCNSNKLCFTALNCTALISNSFSNSIYHNIPLWNVPCPCLTGLWYGICIILELHRGESATIGANDLVLRNKKGKYLTE